MQASPSLPHACVAFASVIAAVLVTAPVLAHADGSPPGLTPPTSTSGPLPSWLQGGVRGGIAYVDYNTYLGGDTELSGAGWWVEAELGWRHGRWTVGGVVGFMSHRDVSSAQTICGPASWDFLLRTIDVGVRVTWHRGAISLGVGLIDVFTQLDGTDAILLSPNDPSPTVFPTHLSDDMPVAELHAGYDLSQINQRAKLQAFGLVETNGGLTSARMGLGVTF